MRRIEITIHSDESGSFQASEPQTGRLTPNGEPFVMAAIAHETGAFTPVAADALWRRTGLGEPSTFHASAGALSREQLDESARVVREHLSSTDGVFGVTRWYRHRRNVPLPREDVYLDVAVHLAIDAVKTVVRDVVDRGSWKGLVPLKVELNLARRQALNLRPLEATLRRHLAVVLRHADLARTPGGSRRGHFLRRGVHGGHISVHCGIVPVEQSVSLALSDLLSNSAFRQLFEAGRRGRGASGEIAPGELDGWLTRREWQAIAADHLSHPPAPLPSPPPTAAPSSEDKLRAALDRPPPFAAGALHHAGLWPRGLDHATRAELIRIVLDEGEDACEVLRDLDRADTLGRLATELLGSSDWRRGLDQATQGALAGATDSLRLAVANHRGHELPRWLDRDAVRERSRRLAGDARHLDDVALLHNRLAVNALNRFAFGEAREAASGLADILRTERRGVSAVFGGPPGPSWSFGALLGTLGQACALHGFVRRDLDLLSAADACFGEAISQFTVLSDTTRQWTYAAHLLLDKIRLAGEEEFPADWLRILEVIGDELDADLAGFCHDPGGADSWRQAYAVHVLLKRAWILDETPDWAAPLAEAMARIVGEGTFQHPRQQLAGLLLLLLELPALHPLGQALRRTAESDRGLVGVIARTWLLDIDARHGGVTRLDAYDAALPEWLRAGWEAAGMPGGLERAERDGSTFAEALPFYYF